MHLNCSTSWYKPGQTPGSVLGEVSSSMEECRAETVALYREFKTRIIICSLSHDKCIQWSASVTFSKSSAYVQISVAWSLRDCSSLQYTDSQDIENIQYITFLLMARAGLRGLEFYDPVNKKHGQAHMQARYQCSFGTTDNKLKTFQFPRLGITQHLIRSGIARLEEVRDANGALVDLYVRVSEVLADCKNLCSLTGFFRAVRLIKNWF